MIGGGFVGRGAADGQASRDIHTIYNKPNAGIVYGGTPGRTDVERNTVTRIDEDHIERKNIINDGRNGATDLV
jgi:hypothetical protein